MFALFAVHKIQPQHREAYKKEIFEDAMGSTQKEPDCLCFYVLHDENDPNTFCLFEAYVDRAAFEKHMTLPHVVKWKNAVKDFYSEEPTVQFCKTLFPADAVWKKVQHTLKEAHK